MLKSFLWKVFENTGNIDAYVFFKEIEHSNKLEEETRTAQEEAAIMMN